MKIKSIELLNVKCFDNSHIELSESINLLIGANNSGKSTIIKSLLNLQYRTFSKRDIRSSENYAKIRTEIVSIKDSDKSCFNDSQYPQEDKLTVADTTVLWGINDLNQPEEYLYCNTNSISQYSELGTVKITDDEGKEIPFSHFPRFSDNENKKNFIYPFLAKRKTDHYDNTMNQNETFRVSDSLRNLGAKIQKIGNASHPKNQEFITLCEEILGFKIGVISDESNGNEPGIYTTDTSTVSIRSMGDGVANIVGFIVILLTEDNKLFLIEELENDIHPKALKKLLELIIEKSTNNQFVISTHSHIVLKYLGTANKSKILFVDWKPFLERNGGKENIPTTNVKEIENSPENRMDILEKLGFDFGDFELHEAYLILEESTAELVIRDFLIPTFFPALYGRLKTIAAKGVEDLEIRVIDFNRLFVFVHTAPIYFKKAWVIADGDISGRECIAKIKGHFKEWPERHFLNFKKNNFEEYYPGRFQEKVKSTLELPHGRKKQEAKGLLVKEVMSWALSDRESAKLEFKESASEVIEILNEINGSINQN